MLNEAQINNIKSVERVIFATADKLGQPRAVWVIPSRIEADKIILSNIQMNLSISNIMENNKCFINVFMPEQDDLQYKIEGKAKVFQEGDLFEEIKTFEERENLPPELKVNSIIEVTITSFEESNG